MQSTRIDTNDGWDMTSQRAQAIVKVFWDAFASGEVKEVNIKIKRDSITIESIKADAVPTEAPTKTSEEARQEQRRQGPPARTYSVHPAGSNACRSCGLQTP